jgi:hypothetical protein
MFVVTHVSHTSSVVFQMEALPQEGNYQDLVMMNQKKSADLYRRPTLDELKSGQLAKQVEVVSREGLLPTAVDFKAQNLQPNTGNRPRGEEEGQGRQVRMDGGCLGQLHNI